MCICFTGELDSLVQKEKKQDWFSQKQKWFVMNSDNAYDLRYPGKMKLEWKSVNGSIIA